MGCGCSGGQMQENSCLEAKSCNNCGDCRDCFDQKIRDTYDEDIEWLD